MKISSTYKNLLASFVAVFLACLSLTSCNKYENLRMQYQNECFGDITVECRDMQIRVAIAAEEANLGMVKKNKEKYIQCRGESDYEELLSLIQKHANYLDDLRPNFFSRHFFSSVSIELPQDNFQGKSKMEELKRRNCHSR